MAIVLTAPQVTGIPLGNIGSGGLQGSSGTGAALNNPNTKLVSPTVNASNTGAVLGASTSAPSQTGGSTYQDKSQDIAMQNAGLGAVDQQQVAGLKSVDDAFNTIMGEYDTDASNAAKMYGNETDANQTDLQGNKQTAMQNAVQGRQGLYGTLASLGALNGDGLTLANNAVAKGANDDLTNAADTFATNQNGLDTAKAAFDAQDKQRRAAAEQAKTNDEKQVQNDAAKNRQSYLTNLANDYEAEGNTGEAQNFAGQAAALAPDIAATNVPSINIGYSGSAFTAPTLSSYVGKANNTTVQAGPAAGGPSNPLAVPSLIAAAKKQGS